MFQEFLSEYFFEFSSMIKTTLFILSISLQCFRIAIRPTSAVELKLHNAFHCNGFAMETLIVVMAAMSQ